MTLCWLKHLSVTSKTNFSKVVKLGSIITDCKQTHLSYHHDKGVQRFSDKISDDHSHPVNHHFQPLSSGWRYIQKKALAELFCPCCHKISGQGLYEASLLLPGYVVMYFNVVSTFTSRDKFLSFAHKRKKIKYFTSSKSLT